MHPKFDQAKFDKNGDFKPSLYTRSAVDYKVSCTNMQEIYFDVEEKFEFLKKEALMKAERVRLWSLISALSLTAFGFVILLAVYNVLSKCHSAFPYLVLIILLCSILILRVVSSLYGSHIDSFELIEFNDFNACINEASAINQAEFVSTVEKLQEQYNVGSLLLYITLVCIWLPALLWGGVLVQGEGRTKEYIEAYYEMMQFKRDEDK